MKIARIILGTGGSKDLFLLGREDGTYARGEGYVIAGKETIIAEWDKAMRPWSAVTSRHAWQENRGLPWRSGRRASRRRDRSCRAARRVPSSGSAPARRG